MDGEWRQRALGAAVVLAVAFAGLLAVDSLTRGGVVDLRTTDGSPDETETSGDQNPLLRIDSRSPATVVAVENQDEQVATAAAAAEQSPGGPGGSTRTYESIRNRQNKFTRYTDVPSAQLQLPNLTERARKRDNGASKEGQFRIACEYSHFGDDDPIVFPGQPGASHLHMFFGNTETDAFTTNESLVDSGGGTCSGYELNRSAYWFPALLDGKGNAVVPDKIIIYYKTKDPSTVTAMPQGLQMIAGNTTAESFETNRRLHWSCGRSGHAYNLTNRIPDCGGDAINAAVGFPNCWDGVNLSAPDLTSHLTWVNDHEDCPSSHPRRLPTITILLYWPGVDSVDGWHLSSDRSGGFNAPPGGTLHADWWGGWNDEAMDLWIDGCMKASRNCSFGQTGTDRQFSQLNGGNEYEGNNLLPLPASS